MTMWEFLPIVSGLLLGFLISRHARRGRWSLWIGSTLLGGFAAFTSGEAEVSMLFCLVDALLVATSSLVTIGAVSCYRDVTKHERFSVLPGLCSRQTIER